MSSHLKPLYLTIEDHLRGEIAAGKRVTGDLLPSEQELAQRFATTRNTVRQALAKLVFEGAIVREKGRGTFVAAPRHQSTIDTTVRQSFEEQMAARGEKVRFRLLEFGPTQAQAAVAAKLQVRIGATLFRLRRIRLIENDLIGSECRYILPELAKRFDQQALHGQSVIAMLETVLGVPLSNLEITVSATTANAEMAALLECRRGSAVLVREHLFHDRDGRPVLTGESLFRSDRYRFTYHLGDGARG
jgi:GntR family transcriptional regulator